MKPKDNGQLLFFSRGKCLLNEAKTLDDLQVLGRQFSWLIEVARLGRDGLVGKVPDPVDRLESFTWFSRDRFLERFESPGKVLLYLCLK